MKNYLQKILVISFSLALVGGCTSFQHLTSVDTGNKEGPKAAECGSCHVLQFKEWSASSHAHAFTSGTFQQAFADDGDEEECLGCHTPLEIRQGNTVARTFNRHEGVTCMSCHLSQGRMHGPHKSSALFHPHPVAEEDGFYLSVDICAACHSDTYGEYRVMSERREVPTCLECHALARQRTATQGTNFFSNLLVSFEHEVDTRSHLISLDTMPSLPGAVQLAVRDLALSAGKGTAEIEIINNLPHNLPTGSFGEKSIQIAYRFFKDHTVVTENLLAISNEQFPVPAGEAKRFTLSARGPVQDADRLEIRLERHAPPVGNRPAVVLVTQTIALPAENLR